MSCILGALKLFSWFHMWQRCLIFWYTSNTSLFQWCIFINISDNCKIVLIQVKMEIWLETSVIVIFAYRCGGVAILYQKRWSVTQSLCWIVGHMVSPSRDTHVSRVQIWTRYGIASLKEPRTGFLIVRPATLLKVFVGSADEYESEIVYQVCSECWHNVNT